MNYARVKRSSLLSRRVNYGRKSFIGLGPGFSGVKRPKLVCTNSSSVPFFFIWWLCRQNPRKVQALPLPRMERRPFENRLLKHNLFRDYYEQILGCVVC